MMRIMQHYLIELIVFDVQKKIVFNLMTCAINLAKA
jgi:hypothetical protein